MYSRLAARTGSIVAFARRALSLVAQMPCDELHQLRAADREGVR
jgi:hypothetical protein